MRSAGALMHRELGGQHIIEMQSPIQSKTSRPRCSGQQVGGTLLTSENPLGLAWEVSSGFRVGYAEPGDRVGAGPMGLGRRWSPGHSVCDGRLQTRLHCLLQDGMVAGGGARAEARARHGAGAQSGALTRAQPVAKASSHNTGAAGSKAAFPTFESTSAPSAATSSSGHDGTASHCGCKKCTSISEGSSAPWSSHSESPLILTGSDLAGIFPRHPEGERIRRNAEKGCKECMARCFICLFLFMFFRQVLS